MKLARMRVYAVVAAVLVVGATLAGGCGGDDDDEDVVAASPTTAAQPTAKASVINVTLKEFEITPEISSTRAGSVTFRANNIGPEDEHELVIIRSSLAPGALPVGADGKVPEDQVDFVDEVEAIAVGGAGEVTVDLTAGSYVLICNIVEEDAGVTESHYQSGMRTAFTVN